MPDEKDHLYHVIMDMAKQIEDTAKRMRRLAKDRDSKNRGTEVANEIRGIIGNLRLDLLVKYGQHQD